jgi:hypothetical protein
LGFWGPDRKTDGQVTDTMACGQVTGKAAGCDQGTDMTNCDQSRGKAPSDQVPDDASTVQNNKWVISSSVKNIFGSLVQIKARKVI